MASSSSSPWWRFRTAAGASVSSGSNDVASTMHIESASGHGLDDSPVASTSAVTLDDLPDSTTGRSTSTRSGSSSPQAGNNDLHSLTEKKLEMAVLGRAVGLRQLVLLSNAFANKARTYATNAYNGSGTSDNEEKDEEGEELEPSIVDLEDDLDRKKREEDWLDSVLDEMLTDEDDNDYDPPPIPNAPASVHSNHLRGYNDRPQGLREPYVHVSIRDRRNAPGPLSLASSSMSLPSVAAVHAAAPSNASDLAVRDSGFLEPASIPLPESTDTSPESSSTSQASDGESALSTIREEDEERASEQDLEEDAMFDMDGLPPLPDSDDGSDDTIPDPYRDAHLCMPSYRDEVSAKTPDLAYSSNSLNSFLTNLSSSPSGSFGPTTPTSTSIDYMPAIVTVPEEAAEADVELLQQPNVESTTSGFVEKESKSLVVAASESSSSLQLVPYIGALREFGRMPPVAGFDDTMRSHNTAGRGILSSREKDVFLPVSVPKLPSALLASILGQKPMVVVGTDLQERSEALRTATSSALRPARVHLPIFLPHEVVKALYDSVDFGLPPKSSSPVSTPSVAQASLPAFTLGSPEDHSPSSVPPDGSEITIRSAPTSPRGRRKSLSLLDIGGVSHDSTGSLLFSSLGLVPMPKSHISAKTKSSRPMMDFGPSLAGVTTASFGRGIVADWAFGSVIDRPIQSSGQDEAFGRSSFRMAGSGRRPDSRSPSRLRQYYALDATFQEDFDFGSA